MIKEELNNLNKGDVIYVIKYKSGYLESVPVIIEYRYLCLFNGQNDKKIFINMNNNKPIIIFDYDLLKCNVFRSKKKVLKEEIKYLQSVIDNYVQKLWELNK